MRKVHVPPSPRIKHAISRTGYEWKEAVLEIIDNAADAIKNRQIEEPGFVGTIAINCFDYRQKETRSMLIVDDGCGVDCTEDGDAIAKVWSLGGSAKSGKDGASYGVFGMGLKGAVQAIAHSATFTSRSSEQDAFQTSMYKTSEESFDIPVFLTKKLEASGIEEKYSRKLERGSLVVLRNMKSVPVKMESVYDALEEILGRIYRDDLTAGKYTISLGKKRTLDKTSGIDPLDGGQGTKWYVGGPNNCSEEVEFEGHVVRVRLSHTFHKGQHGNSKVNLPSTLGSGIKGARKRGVYYRRNGREIAIQTTEGKNLPWSGMPHVSNLFVSIDFDDDGVGEFPIQTDFGKKGVVQQDEFTRFLTKYIEHHIASVRAAVSSNKEVTKSQKEVQSEVSNIFSRLVKAPRVLPEQVSSSVNRKQTSEKKDRIIIERQKYVGKSRRIEIDAGYGVKSSFEFRHVNDYRTRDLSFWLEPSDNGCWIITLNEANSYVKELIDNNELESLYRTSACNVMALKQVLGNDEEKIIEIIEHFGNLWNQYSETQAHLLDLEEVPANAV